MSGTKIIDGLDQALATVKAMSAQDYAAMIEAQRQSWARAMAPCEHGVSDWEDCPACRIPSPTQVRSE